MALFSRIADFASSLLKGLEDLVSAIRSTQKPDPNQSDREIGVRAEVRFTDAEITERRANQAEQSSIQRSIRNAAWCAFLAGFLYAAISCAQWQQMKKQASSQQTQIALQQTQMRLDQQAWVSISHDQTQVVSVIANQPIRFDVVIKNTGKTPAHNLLGMIVIEKLPVDSSPSFQKLPPDRNPDRRPAQIPTDSQNKFSYGVLFPDGDRRPEQLFLNDRDFATNEIKRAVATDLDARQWAEGKYYFALYGYVTYDDIFGGQHWTTFCRHFAGASVPIPTHDCIAKYNGTDTLEGRN